MFDCYIPSLSVTDVCAIFAKTAVYGKEQPPKGNHLHQRQGGGGLRQADTFRDEQARERAEPPTASARRSEEGCPTAPQSATVRRPCRRHDTRRQAQITPHKRSAVWGVWVRCRGQRVGDTPLFRGNVACHGFCTNLPIFCGNFTRFWTENFYSVCNCLYCNEKKSYQQVNNSPQSVLSLQCFSTLIHQTS